jgi:DNA-directed RNA polymerase subunit RPC12/RpoP
MISFSCSKCGEKFEVSDEQGGMVAKCPKCSMQTRIPRPGYTTRITWFGFVGTLLVIVGTIVSVIGMATDIGVETEDGSIVTNLGQMNLRLCLVIDGGVLFLAGVLVGHLNRIYLAIMAKK